MEERCDIVKMKQYIGGIKSNGTKLAFEEDFRNYDRLNSKKVNEVFINTF